MWFLSIVLFLLAATGTEPNRTQTVKANAPAPAAVLTVIDETGTSHALTPDDFARLPRLTAKFTSHGVDAEFSGTSLVELLQATGTAFGKELRGSRTPTVAILEATDGYRVVVSLLEIDPGTNDKPVLVADHRDGKPLDDKEGPYRLILPGDKREVRCIRNLRTILVLNLKDIPLDRPDSKSGE